MGAEHWDVGPTEGRYHTIITPGGGFFQARIVAKVPLIQDAYRIAALPRLCEAARALIEECGAELPPSLGAMDNLRDALAKADGK